jgi:hypothetical protein
MAMDLITDRFQAVQNATKEVRDALKKSLTSKEDQSSTVRVKEKMEAFSEKKDRVRQKNKRELERGIDKTYQLTNRIPYKLTNSATHTEQLREELRERVPEDGFIYSDSKYREITKKMKEIDGNPKYFTPKTSYFKRTFHEENLVREQDIVEAN